ncbi:hypothetical protein Tco_0589395 [Tanacetum coccineum]
MFYHFMILGTDLDYGLLALDNELLDVRNMISYVRMHKLIDVYIEHSMTTLNTYIVSPTKRTRVVIENLDELKVHSPRKNRKYVNFFGLPNCRRNLTKEWCGPSKVINGLDEILPPIVKAQTVIDVEEDVHKSESDLNEVEEEVEHESVHEEDEEVRDQEDDESEQEDDSGNSDFIVDEA